MTRRQKLTRLLVIVAIPSLVLFTVDETQVAIVTALGPVGRAVRAIDEPGLHAKWPWQGRRKLDRRVRLRNARPSECLTADKKNLVIDWYVCWRIANAEQFIKSVRTVGIAELRLEETARGVLTAAMGRTELDQLVHLQNEHPEGEVVSSFDGITRDVLAQVAPTAKDQYGIEVLDLRLRRLGFPEQNKQSVFDRMRAERDRIARKYRAEGEQQARQIRAEADREKEQILSEAYRDAEQLKGEGDARATRIYATAYNRDPGFYKFLRTLETYNKILDTKTTVVLSTDSPLFETLSTGQMPGAQP